MSLFPAYSAGTGAGSSPALQEDFSMEDDGKDRDSDSSGERRLLASDEEPATSRPAAPASPASPAPSDQWYRDARRDPANLAVSTLYYPGRPDYAAPDARAALGAERGPGAGRRVRRLRPRRYYEKAAADGALSLASVEERARDLRRELAAAPSESRALRYVRWVRDLQGDGAALEAARFAAGAVSTRRVRDALSAARARALPADVALAELREELARARGARRLEAWERVIAAAGPAHAVSLAAAALDEGPPRHYPRLLAAAGASLAAAGFAEKLTLLIELAAAMNFPPGGFPPPEDAERAAAVERELSAREDGALGAGLPRGTVWVRVERLRAAARWRAARGVDADADPQRRPRADEVAGVLRAAPPSSRCALLATLLRLARVPALPASGAAAAALGAGAEGAGEALAATLRAARRLPPSHAARPPPGDEDAPRTSLAALLDPPHYFSDATGYLSWVSSLWEAACTWAGEGGGEDGARARLAFLAWRLRWLHALALRAPDAEARRLRREARAAVRRHAPADAHAHALLARLDNSPENAMRALRLAVAARAPPEHALHAARVVAELAGAGAGRHALVAAVLGRAPPASPPAAPPAPDDLAAAAALVERRCEELERGWEEAGGGGEEEEEEAEEAEDVVDALLPGAGEWGGARVALAGAARRAALERGARAARRRGAAARRYAEHEAAALALAAAAERRLGPVADALLPLCPGSTLLALAAAGAPPWSGARGRDGPPLARLVPALLRHPLGESQSGADAVARACRRVAADGDGDEASVASVCLAAGARGAGGGAAAAVRAAAALPHHKWVCVRAAAAAPALAAELADALLERGLRVHTLLDELEPPPPAHTAHTADTADTGHT